MRRARKRFLNLHSGYSKSYKVKELTKRIDRVREGTEKLPSVTEAAVESHEEESV